PTHIIPAPPHSPTLPLHYALPISAICVDVQNTLVNALLLKWASDDIKRRYLPRLATEVVGAYALSEAGSGSDAFGLQTKATKQGDRKSTRLNSSHDQISYAVFCLK